MYKLFEHDFKFNFNLMSNLNMLGIILVCPNVTVKLLKLMKIVITMYIIHIIMHAVEGK